MLLLPFIILLSVYIFLSSYQGVNRKVKNQLLILLLIGLSFFAFISTSIGQNSISVNKPFLKIEVQHTKDLNRTLDYLNSKDIESYEYVEFTYLDDSFIILSSVGATFEVRKITKGKTLIDVYVTKYRSNINVFIRSNLKD